MNGACARNRARKGKRGVDRRRRKERQSLLLAGGAALTLAIASTLAVGSLTGVDVAAAAVTKARSFLDLMSQRSPGRRTAANLIKTKHKPRHYAVLAERSPAQMPVPAAYRPLVDNLVPPVVLPDLFPEMPSYASETPVAPAIYAPGVGGLGVVLQGGGGGGGSGGGGGGTGGGGGGGSQPPSTPEPSTWAMMIAGFGLTGLMMRRGRRDRRSSQTA